MSQSVLFVVNDGPYGSERAYDALRVALEVAKRPETSVRVFLVADGVHCARKGQTTPNGYYNVERMVAALARKGLVAA